MALSEDCTPEQEQLQLWRNLATALRQRQRADRLAAIVQALLNRMWDCVRDGMQGLWREQLCL